MTSSALVLFSGGQDSTVCLVWALGRFDRVETIGFDYGQRHRIELVCRQNILTSLREAMPLLAKNLYEDLVIDLTSFGAISETSLTRERAIEWSMTGLPNSFVPGRNLLFFTYAAALAYRRAIHNLVGGMCEADASGYPDCRDATLKALQTAINLGMDFTYEIHTPLMAKDKASTWRMAEDLGGQPLLNIIREETHSCYLGERHHRHEWGYGCGTCPACSLRAEGWRLYNNRKL
jgi:7-cyano-7-deazaguanine synthase